MQLISNDKFKSVFHRVLVKIQVGDSLRVYGPIKELISEENSPIYSERLPDTTIRKGLTGLLHYHISSCEVGHTP
jgi:hypothetical protein